MTGGSGETTVVHLLRHGEVDNPEKVLYGRLPDYHLSALGQQMAERVAAAVTHRGIVHLRCSPLERAQETVRPIADCSGLVPTLDERLIEAANVFEGMTFGVGDGALRQPSSWRHLRNPFRPSWGEPYREIVVRMLAAMASARRAAEGQEALLVSHQLPIWTVRSYAEGRRLWHDPRRRQCALASLTSFTYVGERIESVTYSEPAADLVPSARKRRVVPGA